MKNLFINRLAIALREAVSSPRLDRCPEPTAVMDDPEHVEAFHAEGRSNGSLMFAYHFNALATSRLLPSGGTLLDLGCGSGQHLSYVARCRPDVSIIGLDLSEEMLKLGNRTLDTMDLKSRVHLRIGDMTAFSRQIPERVDAISSVFALHHLPRERDLIRCLGQISKAREQWGCGIWLFDFARPRHPASPERLAGLVDHQAHEIFRLDYLNSLKAAWSFTELSDLLEQSSIGSVRHACSLMLRLFQVHWLEPQKRDDRKGKKNLWVEGSLSRPARLEFRMLRAIFPTVPLS
jgi:SAM-dependent methyltransferase